MADSIQNLSNLSDEDLQRLASTPVAEPPAGITSNFDNPPSRASLQVWTTSVFLVIAMMFYMNRLYVKTMLMKSWSWDDGMFDLRKESPLTLPVECSANSF